MEDTDDTYAPQSPDLSGYHSPHHTGLVSPTNIHFPNQLAYQANHSRSMQNDPYYPFAGQIAAQPPMPESTKTKVPRRSKAKTDDDDAENGKGSRARNTSKKGRKLKVEVACDKAAPGVDEGIEVKTKFPVARIKRIMQADEDVGKVAQTTPTAVCKLFSCFNILSTG